MTTQVAKTAIDSHDGKTYNCVLCGRAEEWDDLVMGSSLRPGLFDFIEEKYPDRWDQDSLICHTCLNENRVSYLMGRLKEERGELSVVEEEVAKKAAQHLSVVDSLEEQFQESTTFGQRLATRVSEIGGSWSFVIGFMIFLGIWMGVNTWVLLKRPFDPYPYILLNLVLSCMAAIQAPIIMMSQNRLAARDRMEADQDFRVNLKAEIEVASLHEKLDHILNAQWQRMVELQQIQIDLLQEVSKTRHPSTAGGTGHPGGGANDPSGESRT